MLFLIFFKLTDPCKCYTFGAFKLHTTKALQVFIAGLLITSPHIVRALLSELISRARLTISWMTGCANVLLSFFSWKAKKRKERPSWGSKGSGTTEKGGDRGQVERHR